MNLTTLILIAVVIAVARWFYVRWRHRRRLRDLESEARRRWQQHRRE